MVWSIKNELIEKSKEAMMSAIQIYNNPLIKFKSEVFIVTSIISWTYLSHAYYHSIKVDYRYYTIRGKRKRYDRTKHNAYKYWDLERCLDDEKCPFDRGTKLNLKFLIGIRHEIEHQKTDRIDDYIGAKLQACALNYNREMVKLFGKKHCMQSNLSLAIQLTPLDPSQEKQLRIEAENLRNSNIINFVTEFETELTEDELKSQAYAYRIVYVPISVNRANQADKAVQFIRPDSEDAKNIEKVLVKGIEKTKYLPGQIVNMMNEERYSEFSMYKHTQLWQNKNGKDPKLNYGVKVANTWYWYENWLDLVRDYCKQNY
ncbi:DUF3644 domain-containing protein [Globicatella sanguinis]